MVATFLWESNPVGVNGFKRRQTLQIGKFGRQKKAPGRVHPSIRPSYPALQCAANPPTTTPPSPTVRFFPIASVQLAMTPKMCLAYDFGPERPIPSLSDPARPAPTPLPSPSHPPAPHPLNASMSGLVYTPHPHHTLSCPLASDAAARQR